MKRRIRGYRKRKRHCMKDRIMLCAVFFIAPIILFLVGSNLYAAYLLRGQVAASDRNTVELYAEQINNKLSDLKTYLLKLGNNLEIKQLGGEKDYNEKMLAGYQLKNQFHDSLSLYESVADGLFLYEPTDEIYMKETNIVETLQQQEKIEEAIKNLTEEEALKKQISAKWFEMQIGEKYYLIRIYHIHGVYYGSWSDVDRILEELVTIPIEDAETVLLLTSDKTPLSTDKRYQSTAIDWNRDFSDYYMTGPENRYLVIGEPIEGGTYYFVALILDEEIQKGIWLFGFFIVVLIAISMLLLWMFIRYSNEEIAIPLEQVVQGMERAEEGDLDVMLPEESSTKEFGMLNISFNKMLKEIKNLKIKVYEEKIQRQKAQLDFLQIQTNPHFFINAMNVVYNYARLNNMDMVKNMTMSLAKHFRYTLYGETWVLLEEEIEFIQNYLHLQELRTANMSKILIEMEIPGELMDERIPIMTIQPFVENSIKYGESEEREVKIRIEAKREAEALRIVIRDNGDGFEEDVLQALNEEERVVREGKKRIGIQNVRSRLHILYGEKARLCFRNEEHGGAVVEIWLSKAEKEKMIDRQ